jgi:hypothetical protein
MQHPPINRACANAAGAGTYSSDHDSKEPWRLKIHGTARAISWHHAALRSSHNDIPQKSWCALPDRQCSTKARQWCTLCLTPQFSLEITIRSADPPNNRPIHADMMSGPPCDTIPNCQQTVVAYPRDRSPHLYPHRNASPVHMVSKSQRPVLPREHPRLALPVARSGRNRRPSNAASGRWKNPGA